ncbi:hypothetical protein [Corynebacterium aquilae]|uniref:Uncharacterized protein n=1 Tax=Corynebacterium aquilae DSM 44791 TaxID=1431546 RepID=A0A1L7CHP3_9CORY|nr:hypothetical protein [Corynebacterium aquilae]APT85339.1 hypothetical protein CAQU_10030 [Corynebacterium aquilae DSM 44791]
MSKFSDCTDAELERISIATEQAIMYTFTHFFKVLAEKVPGINSHVETVLDCQDDYREVLKERYSRAHRRVIQGEGVEPDEGTSTEESPELTNICNLLLEARNLYRSYTAEGAGDNLTAPEAFGAIFTFKQTQDELIAAVNAFIRDEGDEDVD